MTDRLKVFLAMAIAALVAVLIVSHVPVHAQSQGPTTGCYLVSAASNNATNCKAAPGQIVGIRMVNTTSTIYYLRLYNLAAAPTCSSATGWVESIPIQVAPNSVIDNPVAGLAFSTGIGFCLTANAASNDNTNAATGVYGRILFQ